MFSLNGVIVCCDCAFYVGVTVNRDLTVKGKTGRDGKKETDGERKIERKSKRERKKERVSERQSERESEGERESARALVCARAREGERGK